MQIHELPDSLLGPLLAFEARTLKYPEWTHECHLRVAMAVHLLQGPPGVQAMKLGIQRLNAHFGVEQTPEGGYHETLTCIWYQLVGEQVDRQGLRQDPGCPQRLQRALQILADKKLPLKHYRAETLRSWEARTGWVEPDFAGLRGGNPLHG